MDVFGGRLRMGESSVRRCSSSLVASDVARATSYEKLSQSMRLAFPEDTDDHLYNTNTNTSRSRSSGWRSLLNLFSHKKKQTTTAQREAAPPQRRRRATWVADPHRRWPVQGW